MKDVPQTKKRTVTREWFQSVAVVPVMDVSSS